jgi:hypothetical protein
MPSVVIMIAIIAMITVMIRPRRIVALRPWCVRLLLGAGRRGEQQRQGERE